MKVKFQLFGFLFFATAAICWNVSANIRVSEQSAVCRTLIQELADWEAKAKTQGDWSNRRNKAIESAIKDHTQLFRMYTVCRSADDFIAIHPDQIQCVTRLDGSEFHVFFYLPEGKHQLGVRLVEKGPREPWVDSEPESPSFWNNAKEKLLDLEGGKSYQASITFRHENPPSPIFLDPVSSVRVSISENEFIEFPFEPSKIISRSHFPGTTGSGNRLGLPGQIPDSFFGQLFGASKQVIQPRKDFDLLVRGFNLWRKSDNEPGAIRFGLFIRSEGPARVLPTNIRFCSDVYGPGKSRSSLNYLQFDETNGWYYYPIPAESYGTATTAD